MFIIFHLASLLCIGFMSTHFLHIPTYSLPERKGWLPKIIGSYLLAEDQIIEVLCPTVPLPDFSRATPA